MRYWRPQKLVVATLSGEGLKSETREFGTFTRSLIELKYWLLENGINHVAMGSIGVYWKPVYNVLESAPMEISIVNSRHIKYDLGRRQTSRTVSGFSNCCWSVY